MGKVMKVLGYAAFPWRLFLKTFDEQKIAKESENREIVRIGVAVMDTAFVYWLYFTIVRHIASKFAA